MSWRIDLEPLTASDWQFSRYDLYLILIPTAFLFATLLVAVAAIPHELAVGTAAFVAALTVGDGLFRNPPRRPTPHTA